MLTSPAVDVARAQAPPSLQYYSVGPCRVLDTRSVGQGPALASGAPRIVTVTGGSCGIPATARAIAGNVTSIGPTGGGNLSLYAGDGAVPPTSALNFSSGQTRGNNGVFPLAGNGNGTLAIRATVTGSGTVNVVLDVAGYFVAGPCVQSDREELPRVVLGLDRGGRGVSGRDADGVRRREQRREPRGRRSRRLPAGGDALARHRRRHGLGRPGHAQRDRPKRDGFHHQDGQQQRHGVRLGVL